MYKKIEGKSVAKGFRFALVVSRFNDFISSRLLAGAVDALVRHGAEEKNIRVVWVPGSFEIAPVAQKLTKKKDLDAVICLGVIIRGGTPHFEYVANQAARGIAQVALDSAKPVTFGIITADTLEQAVERAGAKQGNKGADAALAAVELVDLYRKL